MTVIDECRLGGNPIRTSDGANLPVNLVYDFTSDHPLTLDLDHANRPALAPLQLRELGIATKELFLTFFHAAYYTETGRGGQPEKLPYFAFCNLGADFPFWKFPHLFCIFQFRCGLR